ncbi:GATA transcription factor [Salix suchowensis]|nr:GATA transcription factor [Salix suchowensis]
MGLWVPDLQQVVHFLKTLSSEGVARFPSFSFSAMDICRNVTLSAEYHQQEKVLASPPPCPKLAAAASTATTLPLDDLFSAQNTVGLLLSVSSISQTQKIPPRNLETETPDQEHPSPLKKPVIPGKSRSKRRRLSGDKTRNPLTSWCSTSQALNNFSSSDPPLLQQTYWLADSELIMPRKEDSSSTGMDSEVREEESRSDQGKVGAAAGSGGGRDRLKVVESNNGQQQPRRCAHCLAQRTPQWRAGPLGPKTLCNACGVRYKSGRLLPEYRPAKSPTFVSFLHSNSHKKVMEMRMASDQW